MAHGRAKKVLASQVGDFSMAPAPKVDRDNLPRVGFLPELLKYRCARFSYADSVGPLPRACSEAKNREIS